MTLNVLIVEDDFLIALDLEDQVQELGHQVTAVARDEDECKTAARHQAPDIALMDIRLAGGSSGIDASRWLFETLNVRCIFISGNLDPDTRETLEPVEPIAFLGKPILPHQLARELDKGAEELRKAAGG
ncbi:response regulator [Poseidonocella sedimentorum]|uniref:CheY chemotaxis protein or a CheY-like REC (Receiver) domain n=1 Tax=Poseidonocella sedimentorum TaxID=871652 RepID=A0A1I6CV94_9RHOB|nr:response regulator [Poseidonocella sedimentorum]SFQ97001.1 CheY chemotaxis protein or a CheY-like REC (receiver) domain [Poseidonocella sedimentorum]